MTPQTYADLAHENLILLTAVWRMAWLSWPTGWNDCGICGAGGSEKKHEIKHFPGCALFGVDRSILAQLDAFDAMPEPV